MCQVYTFCFKVDVFKTTKNVWPWLSPLSKRLTKQVKTLKTNVILPLSHRCQWAHGELRSMAPDSDLPAKRKTVFPKIQQHNQYLLQHKVEGQAKGHLYLIMKILRPSHELFQGLMQRPIGIQSCTLSFMLDCGPCGLCTNTYCAYGWDYRLHCLMIPLYCSHVSSCNLCNYTQMN